MWDGLLWFLGAQLSDSECLMTMLTKDENTPNYFSLLQRRYRTVIDEARRCINDVKTKDLSRCGSVVVIKDYISLVADLFDFLCSGKHYNKLLNHSCVLTRITEPKP